MRDDLVLWMAHERQETYHREARNARLARRVAPQPTPHCGCADNYSWSRRARSVWDAISAPLARLTGTPAVSRWGQPACECGPGAIF